jgi:hypothetical protein
VRCGHLEAPIKTLIPSNSISDISASAVFLLALPNFPAKICFPEESETDFRLPSAVFLLSNAAACRLEDETWDDQVVTGLGFRK